MPLWAPLYGAGPVVAFVRALRKYATFHGRASRSEFWWWMLARTVVDVALWLVGQAFGLDGVADSASSDGPLFGMPVLNALWALSTLIPTLALYWRRLHDTGRAGPFFFMLLIPAVGWLILLILCAMPSDRRGAAYDRPS